MNSPSLGILQKLLQDLRNVRDPLKDWNQVTSIFTGIEAVLTSEFTKYVQQFQKITGVTFSRRRSFSISSGDGNTYDDRERVANSNLETNERIATNAVAKAISLIDTILGIESIRSADLPLGSERPRDSNSVFLVHGHDNEMKQSVARVLERLSLNPIVLHEQPDGGKTIIEKFEMNASDVGFAVVLMSPDDLGYSKADSAKKRKPRARQNVVMELGYFIGKLGRDKVMVLKRGDLEEPSDLYGRLYTPFDDHDGWQHKLVRELLAAGYTVDANALLK